MTRTHLCVALSRTGWGETSLGLEVARQLRSAGDRVEFLVHSGGVRALSGSGFEIQSVPDHAVPLLPLMLDARLAASDVASILLADYQTTNYTLTRSGVDPCFLLDYDVPLIALDTWDYDRTGSTIDTVVAQTWNVGRWIEQIAHRLVPVPVGQLDTPAAYRALPVVPPLGRAVRRHVRGNLGLGDNDRAVLFCTAGWQHRRTDPDATRLTTTVPQLLWQYLRSLGSGVRLIHVGPVALPLDDPDNRYLWMPSLPPADFDRLLGSADLLLSANISATTVGRAIAMGLPVIVVQNSYTVANPDEATTALGTTPSAAVQRWLEGAVPLYPFSLWPLGFRRFLTPLLRDNPYCTALELIELLDEDAMRERSAALLFDRAARDAHRARQAAYIDTVAHLPSAAQLVETYLH